MNIGIVGAEAAKFTKVGEERAREIIYNILSGTQAETITLVSGGCHLGGIDIWAEEEADKLGIPKLIHLPKNREWSSGYKPRNILIAKGSAVVHNIVVTSYPLDFKGVRFNLCYHCNTDTHIKSGGCWTAKYAEKLGKKAYWHEVSNV